MDTIDPDSVESVVGMAVSTETELVIWEVGRGVREVVEELGVATGPSMADNPCDGSTALLAIGGECSESCGQLGFDRVCALATMDSGCTGWRRGGWNCCDNWAW